MRESAELLALGAAGGVADGAAQVAVVADLDEGEAGVLLVVGAEAAVVGASPLDGSVVDLGHLGWLDEDFAAAAVVIDVVGDEDSLRAVLRAAFEQVDVAVLENGFGFDFAVAGGADGDGYVVEQVGAGFGHKILALGMVRDYGFAFVSAICLTRATVAHRNRTAKTAPRILRPIVALLTTAHVEESKKSRDLMIARKPMAAMASILIP